MLRTLLHHLLPFVPAKTRLLDAGARLPPGLKLRLVARALGALARQTSCDGEIVTNLGMSRRYRVRLARSESATLLFGRPDHYSGERGPLRLAAALAPRCAAFLDVGANLGYFVFHVRAHAPTPIYFFEPDPALYNRLAANVAANRLPDVTGLQAAVAAADGTADFFLNLTDHASGSLTDYFAAHHATRRLTVPAVTLDTFVRERGLDDLCVKADVENAEFELLAGARRALPRVRYLIMEVLGPASARGFPARLAREFGLHPYYINDLRLEHAPDGAFTYRPPEYNWLFCREAPAALAVALAGTGLTVASAPATPQPAGGVP